MIQPNSLLQGDCLDIMRDIPDGSIDAVICDLPYGTTSNKWDSIIPLDNLWEAYDRICKPTAAIVLTASQPFTSMLVMSNVKNFRHEWIWIKNRGSNFANTVREPFKEHEEVVVFSKGHWTYNKQMQPRTGGGADRVKYGFNHVTQSTNYRTFTRPQNESAPELRVPSSWQKFNTEVGSHPTQKPVELFRYFIRTYSNEGETVLDNCCGSGTTAIAAIREKRNYICIEKDPHFYEVARKRIDNELRQPTLF